MSFQSLSDSEIDFYLSTSRVIIHNDAAGCPVITTSSTCTTAELPTLPPLPVLILYTVPLGAQDGRYFSRILALLAHAL